MNYYDLQTLESGMVRLEKKHEFKGKVGGYIDRRDRSSEPFILEDFMTSLDERKRVLREVATSPLQAGFGDGVVVLHEQELVSWFESQTKDYGGEVAPSCPRHIWAEPGKCPVCNEPSMLKTLHALGRSVHPNIRVSTKKVGDGRFVCMSEGRKERFEGGETVAFALVVHDDMLSVVVDPAFGGYNQDNVTPIFAAIHKWQNPTLDYLLSIDDRLIAWAGDMLYQPGDGRCWWQHAPWEAHNQSRRNYLELVTAKELGHSGTNHEDVARILGLFEEKEAA